METSTAAANSYSSNSVESTSGLDFNRETSSTGSHHQHHNHHNPNINATFNEYNASSSTTNGTDEWIELDGDSQMIDLDRQSRFQVAKVDNSNRMTSNASNGGLPPPPPGSADGMDNHNQLDDDQATHHSHRSHSTYDTHYLKSLRHMTREALPRIDHYRNILSISGAAHRPTLDDLHNQTITADSKESKDIVPPADTGNGLVKFGWVKGVFVRCLLNIWGVMLFLRLSWVIGQAGILQGSIIILLACTVTTLTGLSASAICTNGLVRGGGTYYIISRSLGPEFGGAIGLIFSVANAVAVAMYVVGFCESFTDMLGSFQVSIVGDKTHDIRIIGAITIVVLLGITVVGMEWEARAQVGLLFILIVAMVDFVVGSFLSPTDDQKSKGFTGYSVDLLSENWGPGYRNGETFFSVFSVFFPAATGILAGANISGDLTDPGTAIPKGTMLAILVTTVSYIGFGIIAGVTVTRDADGSINNYYNGTFRDCAENTTCKFGLLNNYQVMEMVSGFGPLIYCGCFAATLSSALASLVSAPKVFQALCNDKVYPYIHVFGKGYGRNNEPIRGYVLTFIISLAFILIAELNAIAPVISNFFLASYGLICYSCFHASIVKSPGFRPAFKYYNRWISLLGAILCLAVMFIINWWTALITFGICFALYVFIAYSKPDINWGSSTQAQSFKAALQSVIKLNYVEEHVKNFRPQILVLTGMPSSRPPLVDFVHCITKNLSLMVCGHILKSPVTQKMRNVYSKQANAWLAQRKIRSFFGLVESENMVLGAKSLMQVTGIGKLKPNMVLMGYKTNWRTCDPQETLDYFSIIHEAFDNYMAVGILRLQDGLDYSHILEEEDMSTSRNHLMQTNQNISASIDSNMHLRHNMSSSQLSTASSVDNSPPVSPTSNHNGPSFTISSNPQGDAVGEKENLNKSSYLSKSQDFPKDVLSTVNQFQRKQKKGCIDVWWLYDDGGLTLLLPYILSTRKQFSSCKLRVFSLANRKDELDKEHRNMAALLSKFRIDYSDVVVIPDIHRKPTEASQYEFTMLTEKFKAKDEDKVDDETSLLITEAEILALKDKSNRHIRLREQLLKHSSNSSLIVMTLPMPRKGTVSAAMYMAWLEILTRDMPPFLLVRGNQTSVLTFYS
ncbi:solute carrier 12 [Chamberlinius hualienensis]